MSRLRKSKKTFRDCLVCGTQTNTAHMGIDVCRGCAVFYRRAQERRKPYACRSGTSQCTAGKGLNCRRCRLHHLQQVLKVSVANEGRAPENSSEVTREPINVPVITLNESEDEDEAAHQMEPETSSVPDVQVPVCENSKSSAQRLLSRVKTAYEKLCFGRLMGELFARKEKPSPMQICSTDYPIYPATFATVTDANRILVTSILEFGTTAFPEFGLLAWTMATKFFYTFRILDNAYRARSRLADIPNKKFVGYTLYLSEDIVETFFDDYENEKGDLEEAKKVLINDCRRRARRGGSALARKHLDEQEFCALLGLLFWATNGMGVREEITRISEEYQKQVSCELHQHYRDVLHLDDYAGRMGELYSSIPMFEAHNHIKDTFQVFRLLDIFSDDSFTYMLAKS